MNESSALADWTPEQIALVKSVKTWRLAARELEQIKRKEISDTYETISLLCGDADYASLLCTKTMVWADRITAIVQKGSRT